MSDTLFNLDDYKVAPKPAAPPLRWVLFFEHNGKTYLGRRVNTPSCASRYEWLEEGEPDRKLPTRYKTMSVARRYAKELNNHRTAAGLEAGVIVGVKLYAGK